MMGRLRNLAALGRAAATASGILSCLLLLGLASGIAASHVAAASGPSLVADPASGLADGGFVKVTFTGFPPSIGIAFRQCVASPVVVATDCTAPNGRVIGITDATGSGSTYLPVYAGSDPALKNSGGTGSITCDAGHPCVVAGVRNTSDLTGAVFAPLAFAPSPDLCPPPAANAVLGSGAASAYRAIYAWESTACKPPANLSVGYTLASSPDGVSNFENGLADFGVIGPLPTAPPQGALTYKFAPLTTSAVVLGYRMYDLRGPQVTTLTLTPDLVAQIYLGQIPNWSANAAIQALNPGIRFPPRVVPFARAEHSAQTYVFTSWLAATAPSTWTAGAQQIFPLPPSGVVGVSGSDKMGLAVVDPNTDFFGQGNIGFMDSSTAGFDGLPTVQIKRADGSIVSATPDSIQHAIAAARVNGDGTITANYTTTDPRAYSMPMPTYMLAPTNKIAPDRGATLAAFLRYAVQDGQSILPTGYAKLPANLVATSLDVAGSIPAPSPTKVTNSPAAAPAPTAAYVAPTYSASALSNSLPLGSLLPLPPVSPCPPSAPVASSPQCAKAQPAASAGPSGPVTFLISTAAQYIVPAIAGAGLLVLLAGVLIQAYVRIRRRPAPVAALSLGRRTEFEGGD